MVAGGGPTAAQDLQERLAAAKQAAAKNQQALRAYSWVEKTELSLKGEVKSTKIEQCKYGPDGKVQKTAIVEPPPPQKKRGLKGKIIANKTEEMKEELEAAAALVHQYLPPDPEMMQAVMTAGKASAAQSGANVVALTFADYAKPGDALTLTFDRTVKMMQRIEVRTWLNEPSNPVVLSIAMNVLPDGVSHPSTVMFSMPDNKIDVRITKSNYLKLAQ
jgi:hypothetical protein